jgi:hypothetical protein
MKVAAVELKSDDAAMVKLYPVNEQPEEGIFPPDEKPQATFAMQIVATRVGEFRVGKEFDLLFALPIHQLPAGEASKLAEAKPGEVVEIEHKKLVELAKKQSRALSPEVQGPTRAPDYDLSPDERVI